MSEAGRTCSTSTEGCEEVVATVLQLVVQHAEVQLQQVARWLQLSKSIRQALQQAAGRLSVETHEYAVTIQHLAAIAHWLPCHAALVSSLELKCRTDQQDSPECCAVEEMLSLALQLSSTSRALGKYPQQPLLQLHAFDTNFVFQPAALQSLAASKDLTLLDLSCVPPRRFTAEVCSALSGLRGLRQLWCKLHHPAEADERQPFPVEFAAALVDMTQLTQLAAIGFVPAATLGHLPASLARLQLGTGHMEGSAAGSVRVGISQLTKLEFLNVTTENGISAASQLPSCLTFLELVGPAEAVPGLSQLQYLHLQDVHAALPLLQHLAQQPQLQRLELVTRSCSQEHLQQAADSVSRGTQLTRLHLDSSFENSIDMSGVQMQLHKLHCLQRLKLTQVKWDFEGFSQLTVLSSLTKLKLGSCDIADTGLAVLFQRLTGLRKLVLFESLPKNDCLLAALGSLSNLEHLRLISRGAGLVITSATLALLSPLTKLTELFLCINNTDTGESAVSEAAELAFLDGMPHLAEISWF